MTAEPAPPPADIAAEQAVLGLALRDPQHLTAARAHLNGGIEFYRPQHEALWRILCTQQDAGEPTDPIAVNSLALADPVLRKAIQEQPTFLADFVTTAALPAPETYARIVKDKHRLRRIIEEAQRDIQRATAPDADVDLVEYERLDRLEQAVRNAERQIVSRHVPNIDEFLNADDRQETYDWCIPGLLEHTDRVIVTAGEGAGKSHLGRQIAVQTACGLHPFTGEVNQPKRVLVLDLENPTSLLKREIRGLRVRAGDMLDPDLLRIESRPQGIDLADTPADRDWLHQLVADARPDLIVTGPIYKMADGDPNEEKSAKPVALFLDRIRIQHHCALYLEAHVGNETQGSKKRPQRPFGWSGWRRWPEFGLWLDPDGGIAHWRIDRDARDWPTLLMRGGEWPFMAARDETAMRWQTIRKCILDYGENPGPRELGRRTGIPETTVRRTLIRFKAEFDQLRNGLSGALDDDE